MSHRFRKTAESQVLRIRGALYRIERAATVPAKRPSELDIALVLSNLRDQIDRLESRLIEKEIPPLFDPAA